MRYSIAVILLSLVDCQCLATPNNNVEIFSRKNGLSKQFSIENHLSLNQQQSKIELQMRRLKDSLSGFNAQSIIRTTFLPIGYPERTPQGYLQYSIFSWIQDLSTQLRAILATQRVLEGLGVGREGATALSASINFLVRDGFGMASTLIFTAVSANKFRANVKKWRMFADVINDIGITVEVAATLVRKEFFLPVLCFANTCKAMCGVAAGACNGAINVHWSNGSDISDINAKFGAQHTVTGSLGLIFAAIFAKSVSTMNSHSLWLLYFALTAIHIFGNVKCLQLVSFDYLNTDRMAIVCDGYLDRIQRGEDADKVVVDDPKTVSFQEPLLFFPRRKLLPIRVGVSFDSLVRLCKMDKDAIQQAAKDIEDDKYVVGLGKDCISISISDSASPIDRAKAYFYATVLRKVVLMDESLKLTSAVHDAVEDVVQRLWPHFERSVKRANWDLSKTELATEGYEVSINAAM